MAINWQSDKQRADRFEPEIKQLLAETFITAAPEREDQEEATDLLVLDVRPYRVACRVRTFKYWERYPNEFTVRSGRPSGTKTELAKYIDGWCDYMFYGFADADDRYVHAAYLIDLNVFRASIARHYMSKDRTGRGFLQWSEKPNYDNSSNFYAYDINSFPAQLIKRAWYPLDFASRTRGRDTLRSLTLLGRQYRENY